LVCTDRPGYGPRMVKDEKDLDKGEEVTWSSHGRQVHGKVEQKITSRTEAVGRTVNASADEPQYKVRSDKTGREAVHKPEAWTMTRDT
jgi:Hypervirulence associated proteins TUDOR domain